MREISYRAWHPKNKQMYTVFSLHFNGDGVDLVECLKNGTTYDEMKENELFYAEDVVLMEYTGLRDKLQKKIFEGDIVKAPFMEDKAVGEVIFAKGHYRVRTKRVG